MRPTTGTLQRQPPERVDRKPTVHQEWLARLLSRLRRPFGHRSVDYALTGHEHHDPIIVASTTVSSPQASLTRGQPLADVVTRDGHLAPG